MNTIDILVTEHDNIKRILKVLRKMCIKIIEDQKLVHEDFYAIVDFIRGYADDYHRRKEEDILFKYISNELSDDIGEGPIRGTFLEHHCGRTFISDLQEAIIKHENGERDAKVDIIANAIAYSNLLLNHIHKEDNIIYTYASHHLTVETLEKLDDEFDDFEQFKEHEVLKEKYINLLKRLETKY